MSDSGESNGVLDQIEENNDSVENHTDSMDHIPLEERKEELENVKSSSPVVYIALILTSFFALGMYEV